MLLINSRCLCVVLNLSSIAMSTNTDSGMIYKDDISGKSVISIYIA